MAEKEKRELELKFYEGSYVLVKSIYHICTSMAEKEVHLALALHSIFPGKSYSK